MIDINVPFASLGGNNIIYAAIGLGGFLFTTMGSMMLRCLLRRRKNNKKLKQHQEDIKNITEKVIQDTIKTYNLAVIEEDKPVNRVNRDAREAREALEARVDRVTVKKAEPV